MAVHTQHGIDVHGATLSRRQFVKIGGTLIVGVGLVGRTLFEKGSSGFQVADLDACGGLEWVRVASPDAGP